MVQGLLGDPARAGDGARTLVYYGLGDSVASGYGLPGQNGECKVAPGAYPVVVHRFLAENPSGYDEVVLNHLACSGTESDTLYLQVDEVLADLARRREGGVVDGLVTITVGADLFGWSELPEIRRILCLPYEGFVAGIAAIVSKTNANIRSQLERLLSLDDVYVIVTDFYNPMNRTSKYLRWFRTPGPYGGTACRQFTLKQLYGRTEEAIHMLNGAIGDAVVSFPADRARLVLIHEAFHGREGPWPQCGWSPPGPRKTWIQPGECFHPNEPGVDAIARAIVAGTTGFLAGPSR
jgi:lysophospholipase L1-like esterase